jgi:hypothetical protein
VLRRGIRCIGLRGFGLRFGSFVGRWWLVVGGWWLVFKTQLLTAVAVCDSTT